jgi:SH3-like domain-containing protein
MVTASGGVALRSEPDLALPVILRVDGGGMVERVDSLPGWLRVRVDSTMGWIEAKHILEIDQD